MWPALKPAYQMIAAGFDFMPMPLIRSRTYNESVCL
jgi:hypothetical protein